MIHPGVYKQFQNGFLVIRKSDWFGEWTSTDLISEQGIIGSVKTKDKSMGDTWRLTWLLSMQYCAEINKSMQMFTEFSLETSIQQVRWKRDMHDTFEVLNYLDERSLFARDPSLHNFANGFLDFLSEPEQQSWRQGEWFSRNIGASLLKIPLRYLYFHS